MTTDGPEQTPLETARREAANAVLHTVNPLLVFIDRLEASEHLPSPAEEQAMLAQVETAQERLEIFPRILRKLRTAQDRDQ